MFFFKKPKVVVDCFTPLESVYELYKIRKATAYFPEAIKAIPDHIMMKDRNSMIDLPSATIKRCSGIKEYYKSSAIIPFWTDFVCQPKSYLERKSAIGVMGPPFFFDQLSPDQYTGLFNDHIHVKFHNVWHIKEKTGVKFMWQAPMYNLEHHDKHFVIPPCVAYYDVQRQANLNIFIRKESEDFTISGGEPLVMITPMTEKNVEYRCHLVDIPEFKKQGTPPDEFTFFSLSRTSRYQRELKKAKEMDKKEKKCPFGFGK